MALCTVMEWKDYTRKLEARKSLQGTSENLGRTISLHGSDQYSNVDFSAFPAADDDCFVQVDMYGASDESKQSAFDMGSVMSVQSRPRGYLAKQVVRQAR